MSDFRQPIQISLQRTATILTTAGQLFIYIRKLPTEISRLASLDAPD